MSTPRHTDQPIYWYVLLEQARQRGDTRAAARARRELARLGVRVSYSAALSMDRPSDPQLGQGGRNE